ncbi:MAG: ABC transporter permease subunit [Comamonadaceae bacterium]|nr:ABC transporter permease subunit [Comamonadaceae bacterium]
MTRERERGTLENLLATPVRPVEVMVGKILPYMLIGYVQVLRGLRRGAAAVRRADGRQLRAAVGGAAAVHRWRRWRWASPSRRSPRSQMQSMQMTLFFFLPNILLSGFMFPFRGMPAWAQCASARCCR